MSPPTQWFQHDNNSEFAMYASSSGSRLHLQVTIDQPVLVALSISQPGSSLLSTVQTVKMGSDLKMHSNADCFEQMQMRVEALQALLENITLIA